MLVIRLDNVLNKFSLDRGSITTTRHFVRATNLNFFYNHKVPTKTRIIPVLKSLCGMNPETFKFSK